MSETPSFESLIAPLGLDDFLARHWGREFLLQHGEPSRYAALFSWQVLNDILQSRAFGVERLRLYQGGKALDESRYAVSTSIGPRIVAGSIESLFADGATLILDSVHVHAAALNALVASCEEALQAETLVNVYASRGAQPGFNLHWDWQEAMVLQIDGRKHWQVFAPTLAHPLRSHGKSVPPPQGPPVWEGTLAPGDFLYLPRGWWHLATPLAEPSLHLTVTAVPATGADFIDWVGQRLRDRTAVRADVPRADSGPAARADFLRAVREEVESLLDERTLGEFQAHWQSTLRAGSRFDLPLAPAQRSGTSRVRLSGSTELGLGGPPGGAYFFANGVRWDCPAGLESAIARLEGGGWVEVDALVADAQDGATRARLRTFLAALSVAGVVTLET